MKLFLLAIAFYSVGSFAGDASRGDSSQYQLNAQMWKALRSHDHEMLVKAVDAGAQLDKRDVTDRAPVYWAISNKDWKSVLILIEKGVSPCVGTLNITPLLEAAKADSSLWEGISEEKRLQLIGMDNLVGYRKVCHSSALDINH